MNIISWNIKGAKRGIPNLAQFISKYTPALVFLSEPQLYHCDVSLALIPLNKTYCYFLNSEDTYHPELALEKRRAKGGKLALWHSTLDPFVSILPTTSPAVLPLLLTIPGVASTVHICLYMPTAGLEAEFVIALASLSSALQKTSLLQLFM